MQKQTTNEAHMKKLLGIVTLGVMLVGGATASSRQVGALVPDEVAATIRGGACTGSETFTCDGGNCTGETRYRSTAGSCHKWDCKTDKGYCNGHVSCGDCFTSDAPSCGS